MRLPRPAPEPPDGLRAVDPRDWTRVWRRVITTPSVKLVGYECADWADYKTGANIRPGIKLLRLTTEPPMSNKTVIDALELIRQWGLLWCYYDARKSGIKDDRSIHRLTFPDDISAIPLRPPNWEARQLTACG